MPDEHRGSDPKVAFGYAVLATLLLIAAALLVAVRATASESVCAGHISNAPYVQTGGNPSTLAGSGGVYGCASGSSVTLTVTAQHWNSTQQAWVDQASATSFHWFNPRYSKSYYLTVRFACKVGLSRMVASGDGVVVEGQPVRFTNPDGEGCGQWGGGV